MVRFFVFLLVVLGLGLAFAWMADNPGTVYLQWEWLSTQLGRPGEEVGLPLTLVLTLIIALVAGVVVLLGLARGIFGMPSILSRFLENRKRERGYRALSQGLIAASSGDADTARSLAKESGRLLGQDPLVALLGTQTALLEGKRDEARENFQKMLNDDSTRMVALRGLFLEAERQGSAEAARHYAEEAAREAPSLPWAGNAKLRYQVADTDWDAALQTLEANRSAGLVDKDEAKRLRAVLLTAKALSEEPANPEGARKLARDAHKIAKDLVPAATVYARTASRLGDVNSAAKTIEATWKLNPHPELAEAYATVRAGDSTHDRLKRAKRLAKLKPNHPESNLAVAIAAIDAKEWDAARDALRPVLTTRPTEKACLLMADIEEGQYGDRGRMRDWLSRAVRAPADAVWIADGHVSEEWMPASPVTGEIDAFEWKEPVAQLGEPDLPVLTVEELDTRPAPPEEPPAVLEGVPEAEEAEVLDVEPEPAPAEPDSPEDPPQAEIVASKTDSVSLREAISSGEAGSGSDTEETGIRSDAEPEDGDAESSDVAKNNVVSLEATRQASERSAAESAGPDAEKQYDGDGERTGDVVAGEGEAEEGKVSFPLERRPDDPGVHPDKEPPKKGFKLF